MVPVKILFGEMMFPFGITIIIASIVLVALVFCGVFILRINTEKTADELIEKVSALSEEEQINWYSYYAHLKSIAFRKKDESALCWGFVVFNKKGLLHHIDCCDGVILTRQDLAVEMINDIEEQERMVLGNVNK